jgi:protein ImuA
MFSRAQKRTEIQRLRRELQRLEGIAHSAETPRLRFGRQALDRFLPEGGLPFAGLHLFEPRRREWDDGAASGFMAAMARLFLHGGAGAGPVFWAGRHDDLYGAGLLPFGLEPQRLLLARAAGDAEVFWCLEEALADGGPALVLGEAGELGRIPARRLQLAAETARLPCFLLLRPFNAPRTRPGGSLCAHWRIAPAPSGPCRLAPRSPGLLRWQAELLRCRGGRPGAWLLEWNDETCDFSLAAPLRDGALSPAVPAAGGGGGRASAG